MLFLDIKILYSEPLLLTTYNIAGRRCWKPSNFSSLNFQIIFLIILLIKFLHIKNCFISVYFKIKISIWWIDCLWTCWFFLFLQNKWTRLIVAVFNWIIFINYRTVVPLQVFNIIEYVAFVDWFLEIYVFETDRVQRRLFAHW